jgi:hypothetical protein
MVGRSAGDPGRDVLPPPRAVDAEHRHQAESSPGMEALAASLVGRMADGTGVRMPSVRVASRGRTARRFLMVALRDLRVRIVTTDARFEVPVER